jgi:hypothetical protein
VIRQICASPRGGLVRALSVSLLACLSLGACGGDEVTNPGAGATHEALAEDVALSPDGPLVQLDAFLADTSIRTLLDLLNAQHADIRARLGAHAIHYEAHFELKPQQPLEVPAKVGEAIETDLDVDDELEFSWAGTVGGHPHAALRQQNSQEDRRELILLEGRAYTRLHEDQWYQRELDGDLHESWFQEAYASVHDFVEFAAPQLRIAEQKEVDHDGRTAIALTFEQTPSQDDSLARDGSPSRWRASSRLDSAVGEVLIDRQTGVWLSAKFEIGWRMTDRAQRPLIGKSRIDATLKPGKVTITAPLGAQPMPERHRYRLERDKLLDGLAAP